MSALVRCLVLAVAACGSSQRAQPTSQQAPQQAPQDASQGPVPDERVTYPRTTPVDPCVTRTEVAMACWDHAAAEGTLACERIRDDKRAELTAANASASCIDSLAETCLMGCGLQRGGNETRDHFYMLMTSPPP